MSTLQFTLFFVALLVGYVLVHLRLVRFEEHLQKLAGLRSLDDRLKSLDDRVRELSETVDKKGLGRVTAQLDQLHEDLEDLRESAARAAEAQVAIPATPPVDGGEGATGERAGRSETAANRIVAVIETRLLQLGYRNLRLLGDLSGAQFTDEIELTVETERNGMPCKGRVIMRNGSVSDVHIQPVTQAFP
ncbi:MAG: hypothetical protein KAI24_14150 [Planctomycetes bacterium]|nr:hypothetical protein [Planctomycetota bacterium]